MVRDASGAASIEDFARDVGIASEADAGLTQGVPNGSVSQMGVQKENAAGGVFEGQAEATAEDTIRKVARERGLSESETRAMTETYRLDGASELDAKEYAERFAMVAKMGRDGAVESAIDADEYLSKLPESSRRVAYKAGQTARTEQAATSAQVKYSSEESTQIMYSSEESVDQGLLEFYRSVTSMKQKNLQSKRKKKIGKISKTHAHLIAETIKKETGKTIDVSGYDLYIDGSTIQHIEDRHGQKGTADRSMADPKDVARIGWAANNAQEAEVLKNADGSYDLDYNFKSRNNEPSYKVKLSQKIDGGEFFVVECVPDSESKRLYVKSAYIQKNSGTGTELNMDPNGSPQHTPKAQQHSNTANNSIPQTPPVVNKKNAEISRPSLRPGRVLRAEGVNVQKFSDAQYATYKAAEIMARALGTDIVIHESLGKTKDGKVINGYFDPGDGRIHVNINAMRDGSHVGLYVLSHEVTHAIKEWSPARYAELEAFVMERLGEDADALIEAKRKQLREAGLISETATEAEAYALAKEEVVAEGMENVLSDGKVLEALAKQNRTLWQKIKDVVTAAIGKIKAAFGDLNKHSKTAKVLTDTVESLESLEQLFYEGVVDAGEARRGGLPQNGTSFIALYDIVELDNGMQYVEATESQVIKGEDPNKWAQQVASYINRVIRGGTDLTILTTQGDKLTITRDTAYKAGTRNQIRNPDGTYRTMTDAEYRVKLNAEIHINELAEVSQKPNKPKQPDYKNHAFAKDGFTYRTAYFKDFDGKYYKLTISVGENGDVSTVYNVGKIKEDTLPSGKVVSTFSGSKANSASSPHSISQDGEAVKPKLSISDETLIDKYPHLDLNQDVSGMDGVPAIRLEDGSVLSFTEPHVQFIQQNGIDVEDIESGGWISDGVYEASERSDTLRYKERMMAKKRMDAKRASKAKFSIESGDPSVDTDVNENEAGEASPSPTEVETEVQNEAVARVEKEVQRAREQRDRAVRRER